MESESQDGNNQDGENSTYYYMDEFSNNKEELMDQNEENDFELNEEQDFLNFYIETQGMIILFYNFYFFFIFIFILFFLKKKQKKIQKNINMIILLIYNF